MILSAIVVEMMNLFNVKCESRVLENDEFCIKKDEVCIENGEF